MTDASWRRLQRAWEADPGDQAALRALIAARQRARLPVGDLRARHVLPPVEVVVPPRPARIVWIPVDKHAQPVVVQDPPGARIRLPAHHGWSLDLERTAGEPSVGALLAGLGACPSSLVLSGALDRPDLVALRDRPGLGTLAVALEELSFDVLSALGSGPPDLHHLTLKGAQLDRPLRLDPPRLTTLLIFNGKRAARPFFESLVAHPLETLRIDGSAAAADDVLVPLEGCWALRSLIVNDWTIPATFPLTNAALTALSRLELLTQLKLRGNTDGLNDAGFAALARLERLTELDLSWLPAVSDDGLAALRDLPLRTLHLGGACLSAASFHHLPSSLQRLTLTLGVPLTEVGLRALARFTELRSLALWDVVGDPSALEPLRELPRLRALEIRCSLERPLSDDALAPLAQLSGLEELTLECWQLTEDCLEPLNRSSVATLYVDDCPNPPRPALLAWEAADPERLGYIDDMPFDVEWP